MRLVTDHFTEGMMATEIATGELLELRAEAGGLSTTSLENRFMQASWALGRFEWSYRKEDWPWFFSSLQNL